MNQFRCKQIEMVVTLLAGGIMAGLVGLWVEGNAAEHDDDAPVPVEEVHEPLNAKFTCKSMSVPLYVLDNVTGFTVEEGANVSKWVLETSTDGIHFYIQQPGTGCQIYHKG